MNKKWYLYVNALSSLGSRMNLIACSALIFTFEHSAYWMTAFFVARQLGGMLFSPLAGMLADRMDRRRTMIVSDLGAGLAILAIAFYPTPYVLIAAAFLNGMLYTLFHISFQASLPQIFGSEQLVQVNGLKVRLESLVGIMGFMLGGWLTDHYGYTIVIALDAASFLFSAWILTKLRWEEKENAALATSSDADIRGKAASGFRVTLRYLRDTPVLLTISLLAFLVSLSTSAYNYGLPFLADQLRGSDATLHGLMWTAMSVGGLIGSYVAARLQVKLVNGMLVAYAVFSVGIVGAFAANHAVAVLLLLIFAGLFSGAAQVYESTLLQQAQNELRGKVMGVQGLLSRSGYFAGFLMAPFLAGAFTLLGMLVFAQLMFVAGLIGFGLYLVISPKKSKSVS
ncbi:MFS transporter [Brevibacillus sp. HB1.4B]|uniref:MFS transporter n=1 Tax=Brevibacillus sp. HB1.4B TaxID=2738845 RepID=UPI000365351D|nr:MFS transporter [Brevibacillus sp. HB1.4B]ATF15384.1 MFS transporter [Brevibacillus brevis X23]NRS17638.1 MFS transporter [Brevibacillus sp. HB1.4B]